MNEDLERLEMKVCFLESQSAELNEVVIEQSRTITALELKIESLEKKVEDLIEITGEARPNRRPPHY